MSNRECRDCRSPVPGKIRRQRCENCYRTHVRNLKKAGAFTPRKGQPAGARGLAAIRARVFRQTTPGRDGCVIYTGRVDRDGYAVISITKNGRGRAHRKIYEAVIGAIPTGLVVDHLCHTTDGECPGGGACLHRRCVNPRHLEPVTPAENNARGLGLTAANARKTHCVNGHEFSSSNTAWRKPEKPGGRPGRRCRSCARERKQAARQKAA